MFTFSIVNTRLTAHRSVAEDIYLTYPNAEKTNIDNIGEVWILPCTEEVRMVFRFGEDSDEIPIHPLDATL